MPVDRGDRGNTTPEENDDVPEGGWGWVIAASNCCALTMYFGLIFTLPIFLVEWMFVFDANATTVSWVVSLANGICGLFSPLAGVICTRHGSRKVAMLGGFIFSASVLVSIFCTTIWQLIITLGLSAGIGGALFFTPSIVMLGHYFQKRYVLANSISFLGFGFAQMFMPRFVQFLNEEYGWRGALLILSAVLSHTIICGALLRPRIIRNRRRKPNSGHHLSNLKPEMKVDIGGSLSSLHNYDKLKDLQESTPRDDVNLRIFVCERNIHISNVPVRESEEERTRYKGMIRVYISNKLSYLKYTYGLALLVRNIRYQAVIIGSFLGGFGWSATNGHLVARAIVSGISENDAALLVTLIGIGSITGRASHGIIIDKGFISKEVMFIIAFGATSLLTFVNPAFDSYQFLCVVAILFGLAHGISNSLVFAFMRLQVGGTEAAAALSIGSMTQPISNTIGIVIAGLLFDITNSYTASFLLAGTTILSGSLLIFLILIVYQRFENTIDKIRCES